MKKRLLSLLLCAAMVFGMMPSVVPTAWATEGDAVGLVVANGVTFSSNADQLAMEEAFDAVPLSFEATVMLPDGYTDRAGVITGNWRNGANSGEFDSTREYVSFEISTNGNPRLYWQESHGKSTSASHKLDLVFTEVSVATGEFVHLAVTYDPDTDTACCYVDGVLEQSLTNGNITPAVPFGPLKVGGDYRDEAKQTGSNAQYFKGTIANLSAWSSVLTETEVKAHYDALCADGTAVPAAQTGLLGSWDFSAGDSATTFADKAGTNDVYVFEDWVDDITFASGDYTMLVMPDPQILMKWKTESWYKYTQWIADNVDDLNIQAVISVGDMINDNNTTQWTQSVKGVKTFEDTGVPWIPMRGNHDPSAEFNTYYPYSNYSQKPWFGGSYEEGKMDNCYWFVTVGDREYMILYLGWAPSWDVLDWAEGVVQAFPEKNVIVSTHAYMNWDSSLLTTGDGGYVGGYSGFSGYPEGTDIWEKLGKYENVVLALGGHIGSSDLACWEDENGAGNTVTSMLVDSQHLDYVNAGLVCLLTFHEDSDVVDVNWYSPVNNAFFRTRNQFSITVPHVAASSSTVDTTGLKAEIFNAENLPQVNYTTESWTLFASAMSAAKAVLEDDTADQEKVDAAETALENARAALVERSGLAFSASAQEYAQFSACAVIPETVEIWVKIPKDYTTRNMIAGGYGYNSATASTEIFWALEMNAGGTLRWWEEGTTGTSQREMAHVKFDGDKNSEIKINTGEWMLISIVRDQENKEIRAYINGELAGTSKKVYTSNVTSGGTNVFDYTTGKITTDPTRLGRDWRETAGQTALTFEGTIGEIRTWADDRTADEIKAGFESGIDLTDENLYGCWQLSKLPSDAYHPYTFNNLATGTAAVTDLSIQTLGFTSPRETTALSASIAAAKALVEEDYTADSWAAMGTTLASAETVLADTTTTQAQVLAAKTALDEAVAALVAEMKGLTFSASEKNYAEFSQKMVIPETVEVWLQIPKDHSSRCLLAGGYGITGKGSSETFWGIDYYSNGKLYWWEETGGKELWAEVPGVDVATGEWLLLSIVRDQDNDEIRAYVNGELAATITNLAAKNGSVSNVMDYTTGKTTTIPIRLGRDWREDQGKPIQTYEGLIGEMRVYSDDRTAEEIKAGYLNDLKADSVQDNSYLSDANLTGCWRLRDLTGIEYHPYTFENLSTGTGAVSSLTISTLGFTTTPVDSDKTALQADVTTAKAMVEEDYAETGWDAFVTARTEAEEILANPLATQEMVDEAEDALEEAIAALVAVRSGLQFEAASLEYAEFTANTLVPETLSVWVKIPTNSTKREMIVGSYGKDNSNILGWGIEANANGKLRWWEEAPGDLEIKSAVFDSVNLRTGEWTLVTIVRDQENDAIHAYINGKLAGTTTAVLSGETNVIDLNKGKTTNRAPRLGLDYRTSGLEKLALNGEISDLRIWTDDRTADEIKAEYANDMKGASVRDKTWLSDDNLFGAWQLRELSTSETHPYTFANLATGTAAATAVGIRTDGFKNPAGTVYVDGLDFSAAEKHYAQFTACTEIPETVEVWVKIPKGYSSREMIVGGYGVKGKGQTEIFWSVEMNASGTLRWWEEGTTGTEAREMNQATFSNVYINTGEWTLITIVRDQENKQVKAYINGELAGTTTKINSKIGSENVFGYTTGKMTTDSPRLGRDWRETLGGSNVALTFEGEIGELRMWSDDRTDAEIKAGYENDILADDKQTDTYLEDANLYGAWRLRDLTANESHPYIFPNQATGTGAATGLGIRTVGFIVPEDDVAPDYTAQYTATGISFSNSKNQMRAEQEFDSPVRTISALVNVPSDSTGGVVFGNDLGYIGGYASTRSWMNLEVNSSGQPVLKTRYAAQNAVSYTADTVDLRGEGWVLVTCVFDDECDIVRWFIDGKRVETITGAAASNPVRYEAMKFGGDSTFSLNSSTNISTYNSNYFKGEIAYVSAWSSVRNGPDILAEAQALQSNSTNVPTTGDGLMGSWSFAGDGDILKTVYADKSGNGNDAVPYATLVKDYDQDYLKANNIASELPKAEDGTYSVVIMPDIQNITRDHMGGMSEYLDDYMQWIADNKETYNIVAYLNMGDLTQDDHGTSTDEWETVQNAIPILENSGIPGVPMRGNHDRTTYYSQYIDYDFYAEQSWFGGVYEDGYLDNSYWFFEAGGRTYLVFSLGWSTHSAAMANNEGMGDPDNAAEVKVGDDAGLIAWVNGVIEQYPNANVIFTAHNGMSWTGDYSANGQKLYDQILSKHDNIVLASYGHIDDYVVIPRTDKRADGVEFPSLLVDGQGIDQYEGCHAFICLLTFKEGSDDVQLNWYSVREGSLYRVDGQYSITVPHVEGVDLSELEKDIAAAKALAESEYTTASWTALQTALQTAETAVEEKLSVTQTEVDKAEDDLEAALAALVKRGDKTTLTALVSEVKALTEADYTTATWADVKTALTAAEAELADVDALQTELDTAETALAKAKAALVRRGDKADLAKLVGEAEALAEADYTSDTWAALETALTEAKKVLEDQDALQSELDTAETGLDKALDALVKRGDKSELASLADKSEALTEANYTTDSWEKLEKVAADAEKVLADPDATQAEVDAAAAALEEAVNGLKSLPLVIPPVEQTPVEKPPVEEPEDCTGGPACPSAKFEDIKAADWFHPYVDYVVLNGLMSGVGNGKFAPNDTMTRAMVWTVLARLDGENVDGGTPWYAKAQAWSMAEEVSDGTMPNEAITREQLVTMLYRFLGEPEVTDADRALLDKFSDGAEVSEWAVDAMAWAVSNGIITGVTETTLDPQGVATRAQVAAILKRFCEMD